jgi:hypothetical protein
MEDGPSSAVLDNKKGRVKLKKHRIIMSEFTDREQIFTNGRNMKQIFKNEGTSWTRYMGKTYMIYRQTCTVSHTNLVKTRVCIRGDGEVVQVMSEVVSGS